MSDSTNPILLLITILLFVTLCAALLAAWRYRRRIARLEVRADAWRERGTLTFLRDHPQWATRTEVYDRLLGRASTDSENRSSSEELQVLDQLSLAISGLLEDVREALLHGNYTPEIVEQFRARYSALEEQLATVRRFVRYSEIVEDVEQYRDES